MLQISVVIIPRSRSNFKNYQNYSVLKYIVTSIQFVASTLKTSNQNTKHFGQFDACILLHTLKHINKSQLIHKYHSAVPHTWNEALQLLT